MVPRSVQLAAFLLAVCLSCVAGGQRKRYCGNELEDALALVCGGKYNSIVPFTAKKPKSAGDSPADEDDCLGDREVPLLGVSETNQAAEECCNSAEGCTKAELQTYCTPAAIAATKRNFHATAQATKACVKECSNQYLGTSNK